MSEISEIDWSRLATIVDCDGCISIDKRNSPGRVDTYATNLRVANTDVRLIDWLIERFGGKRYTRPYEHENWKRKYEWNVYGYQAYKLISSFVRFSIIKKDRAELAIRFYEECTRVNLRRGKRRGRPEWMISKQEDYFQQMKVLNQRGVKEEKEREASE